MLLGVTSKNTNFISETEKSSTSMNTIDTEQTDFYVQKTQID
jgi:hypothetical protein